MNQLHDHLNIARKSLEQLRDTFAMLNVETPDVNRLVRVIAALEFLSIDAAPSERAFVTRRARELAIAYHGRFDEDIAARLRALGAEVPEPSTWERPLDVLWTAARRELVG